MDDSLRISVIFRGKGKRISADEKAAYHKDVDIYWQGNAWADTDVSAEWVRRILAPAVADLDEFVLFCDNLEGQISLQFRDAVRKLNGIVWYGLANATDLWHATDLWQPVDVGAGYLIKKLIDAEQQQWLEDDENVEKWLDNSETKLSAQERRILLTHWIGEAYRKFRSETYAASRYRCFEKTGCLISADGSEDSKIKPEGLHSYSPATLANCRHSHCHFMRSPRTGSSAIRPNDNFEETEATESGDVEVDYEQDRDITHHFVGKEFRVCYDYDWFTGVATWFNVTMAKLRLESDDGSDDYIALDEINGIEIICL